MLHSKFQGKQPTGSGGEDSLRLLPYMRMIILIMWPEPNM